MDSPTRIFLSPHSDDIAFSCFGSLVNPPPPSSTATLIVTVFNITAAANGSFGQGKSPTEIRKIREDEDESFARAHGCRLLMSDLPDSSIRQEPMKGPPSSLEDSTVHAVFEKTKAAIAAKIGPYIGRASIHVPLGVGGHIDHRMVRDAARQIVAESGIPGALSGLIYYEDLPYAAFVPEYHIKQLAKRVISATPRSLEVSLKDLWGRKKKAFNTYASQLSPVVSKALSDHAVSVGNDEFPGSERLWTDDTLAVAAVVDVMAWVTWEAARRVGGYTTLFKHIFASPRFRGAVGRTILLGPMYMPIVCPEYDPLEDIHTIASNLGSSILFPPDSSHTSQRLPERTRRLLLNIEARHGVDIFYLRDQDQEHQVDRILFNFSRVLDNKSVYMESVHTFLADLKYQLGFALDFPITKPRSKINGRDSDAIEMDKHNVWKKDRSDIDPSFYAHKDSDSTYGIMLAQPASECLKGLMDPGETCLLIATEELNLPTVYAAQVAREKYSQTESPIIKTLFYPGDNHPIRNLVTGAVSPKVPELNAVGGFDFEGPMRSLIKLSLKNARTDGDLGMMPVLDRYFLDFEPLQDISSHTNMQIVQQAWQSDSLAATSLSSRDELVFLNRDFATKGEIPIISPGVSVIPCDSEAKESCRARLISYARLVWGFEDLEPDKTIIATQIARAVAPKGFVRALSLLRTLCERLRDGDSSDREDTRKVLFIIVTSWDERRTNVGDYRIIDNLLHELGGSATFSSKNLRVRLVNQPRWPLVPELHHRGTGLTRDDLHRATDLSLCLSLYDTFAIAPLEPMSCGAYALVSTGCGCYRKILELDGWQTNVRIVDYAEEWIGDLKRTSAGDVTRTLDAIFTITLEEKMDWEARTHKKVALDLLKTVPSTASERAEKIQTGRRLAVQLNWEDQFGTPLVQLMEKMFEKGDL